MRQEQLAHELREPLSELSEGEFREIVKPKGTEVTASDDYAESEKIPFPEIAWRGLFKTWRDMVAPTTEAPLENLWAVFAVTSGLILGRNVRVENPKPIYPNFYTPFWGIPLRAKKLLPFGTLRSFCAASERMKLRY